MKKWKQGMPVAICFAAALSALSLWSLAKPDDVFSRAEKRYLAKKPRWNAEEALGGVYQEKYENYLGDQFPGRLWLARLRTGTERLLGKQEVSGIYFGKDDYLIERHSEEIFSTELAGENEKKLWELLRLAERKGISRREVLLAPSTEAVLREKLPTLAPEAAEKAWYRGLRERGEREIGDISWCEAEEALRKASREQQIYYRTDHHWNLYGAYVAYTVWAENTGRTPAPWEAYERISLKEDFYGSLSAKVQAELSPDALERCSLIKGPGYRVTYNEEEPAYESLYVEKNLATAEPYAVYLNGNQPITRISQENPGEEVRGKKLLMAKDSFGNSLALFLAEHFEEIVMIDLRFRGVDLEKLMEEEQFTELLAVYNRAQLCQIRLQGL